MKGLAAYFNWRLQMLIVCAVISALFLYWYSGGLGRETNPSQAAKRFAAAGGVEKVNQEAKIIFDRFGTKDFKPLDDSDLKDFHAIPALGNTFSIWPQAKGLSAHIRVGFGYHMHYKNIYIFYPQADFEFKDEPSCIQIGPNIFVDK